MNDLKSIKLITRQQLIKALTISEAKLWRWQQESDFPKSLQLGPKRVAYRVTDIEAWLSEKSRKNN